MVIKSCVDVHLKNFCCELVNIYVMSTVKFNRPYYTYIFLSSVLFVIFIYHLLLLWRQVRLNDFISFPRLLL